MLLKMLLTHRHICYSIPIRVSRFLSCCTFIGGGGGGGGEGGSAAGFILQTILMLTLPVSFFY